MQRKYLPELIKGNRIYLKRYDIKFAKELYGYISNEKARLAEFLTWPPFINSVEDEENFIKVVNKKWNEYKSVNYGIYNKENNQYMGNISAFKFNWTSANCEIGYWILKKYEGNGFVSESLNNLEEVLYDIGFNRLEIRFDPNNKKSGNIPKKLNYTYEGTLRNVVYLNGTYRSLSIYSKLKTENLLHELNEPDRW